MAAIARAHQPKESQQQRYARYLADVAALDAHDAAIPDVQVFEVTPVPKPRMTGADAWQKRPPVLRYRAMADHLRALRAQLPYANQIDFVIEMPETWPEELKAAMDGKPHLLKPDASNLVKAVEDALVPKDEVIHNQGSTKRWGRSPLITIRKAINH